MESAKNYASILGKQFMEFANVDNKTRDLMATDINYAMKDKFVFFDIRSAMCDPSDFKGLPSLTGSYVKWLPDIIFRIASRPDFHGLIFFDEVNQALPAVQSALYQVILDNTAGTTKLSDGCLRVAAGNRAKDRSNVNNLSKALMQRFMNVELATPTADEWLNGFAKPNNLHMSVISYISYKREHLNRDVDNVKEQRSFANPRNWARMAQQMDILDNMYQAKDGRYFSQIDRLADANIGGEEGSTFAAYMKLHAELDIDKIIADPSLITQLSLDRKWFALDMLAAKYAKDGIKLIPKIAAIYDYIDTDIAVNSFRTMMVKNKLFNSQMQNNIDGAQWMSNHLKFLI